MPVFLLAGRDELAREQSVEQPGALDLVLILRPRVELPAQLDAEVVPHPLRIKFEIVANLDGAGGGEEAAEGGEGFGGARAFSSSRVVAVAGEPVEVDDVDGLAGRGELDEADAPLEG